MTLPATTDTLREALLLKLPPPIFRLLRVANVFQCWGPVLSVLRQGDECPMIEFTTGRSTRLNIKRRKDVGHVYR